MIKAIIFDMDGVISDTQKLHSKVEAELLKRFGIEISTEEITQKYSGVRTKDFFEDLLKIQDQDYNLDELMHEKWEKMQALASKAVDPIPGAIELIKRLHAEDYPMAVASASNLNYVQSVLKTLGVFSYFSFVVSGDMVSKGKPDPESFLLAAAKIGVQAKNCLVIEDGTSGMQAAKKGNMHCIGLVKNKQEQYPTQNLVLSLAEITPGYLKKITKNE